MPASMVKICGEQVNTRRGFALVRESFACIGLTPSGANTVPFPNLLPKLPRHVLFTPMGNNAVGVIVSLDDSQGAPAPANSFGGGYLGFDLNNLYVFIGAGTEFRLMVEY